MRHAHTGRVLAFERLQFRAEQQSARIHHPAIGGIEFRTQLCDGRLQVEEGNGHRGGAVQTNFSFLAANTIMRISSRPCRQRWMFVVP